MAVEHRPPWAYAALVLGIVGILIVMMSTTRRVDLRLPTAEGVRRRQAFGAVALVVGFVVLLTGILAVVSAPGLVSIAVLVASIALLSYGRNYRLAWVGGTWADDTQIRLTRLDPAFAAALAQVVEQRRTAVGRLALAGWHPDPSGEHPLRYFDGTQWTEHVR